MAALSKFQQYSANFSMSHLFYGATTIVSVLSAALFISVIRRTVPLLTSLKAKKVQNWNLPKRRKITNELFLNQLYFLLKIIIPRSNCKETWLVALYTVVLLSRTFLSIYIASLEGYLIKTIVEKQPFAFIQHLIKWFTIALPATFINSMIKAMEDYVAIAFRARLTQYAYNKYLSDCTYYKVNSLDGRLRNVDQCLTDDIMAFCQTTSRLFSLILKPVFDIALIGFSELLSEESKKKGSLRFLHSRLISNSEEVALYRGHETEKICLLKAFDNIQRHAYLICRKKILYIMAEQYLLKYTWTATGMIMIALPIFTAKTTTASFGNILYFKVIELSGYTSRVYQMFKVFEDVKQQKFTRTTLETTNGRMEQSDAPEIRGQILQTNGVVKLCNVPIITPAGNVIVNNFNIEIHTGMHLFITGPNGCGKSSLFRILGGLWPVHRGRLELPPKTEMYYLPQRPYMTFGNLREQIIYPDTLIDMRRKGTTDSELIEILKTVHLSHIVEREGGFESEREWTNVLSGGEKQRLGLARIFYHQPKYALLDECTSAISVDIEALIYQAMKDAGFTLLSVSHRPSLWKFHTHLLQYDGQGRYRVCRMDSKILTTTSDINKNELFDDTSSTKDPMPNCSSSENTTSSY
uniref:ABC transporter domain-containing protein n=1 Tax=Setaria digitata TaxID=48799 RepID=A0A915PE70_9BILA